MADDPKTDPVATEEPDGISEDDLRKLVGEEIDKRLTGFTESLGGIADGIVEKLQGSATDEDTLLGKIGGMLDEKLKGIGSGSNGKSKEPREPKLKIFG